MRSSRAGVQKFQEEPAALVARGLLQVFAAVTGESGNIRLTEGAWKTEARGEPFDKTGVLARFLAAQLMIEVQDVQVQVPARGQLEEHVQQAHGIRAAGHRHANALAGLEHAEAFDGGDRAFDH